jgi:hypothetical protein
MGLIANFTDGDDNPVNYNQTNYHPNRKERWNAMCAESENIEKKGAWEIVDKILVRI